MKLHIKMMLLFSVIMMAALIFFSSYTIDNATYGSDMLTSARFQNMSTNISDHLEQSISMMHMTIDELTQNASFISSLNQFVRDDSTDQKMGLAARKAALQILYQSPLVDQYYRVSFISTNGKYLTSLVEKDFDDTVSSADLMSIADFFTDTVSYYSSNTSYHILSPHTDLFTQRKDISVYGIIQPVQYFGNTIGYISVVNECSALDRILEFVDNLFDVEVQLVFDDDTLLYCNREISHPYPTDLPTGEMQIWNDTVNNMVMQVLHTRLDSLGLNLYVAQDKQLSTMGSRFLQRDIYKRLFLIFAAAFLMIGVISFGLTRSIQKLTRRIRRISSSSVLPNSQESTQSLTETVTNPHDREVHALELTYNDMMLRLRDSTLNEMALRESALQAQLNALQTQINPHFIYNTLNIISAKSLENGSFDVIEICDQFASMLRYSTDTRSRTATMQEEIENARSYLLLAKARYEDNLEFTIDVPEDLQNIRVPKLTLQPLIENALTHGYDGKNIRRELAIIGRIEDRTLTLQIRDNGTGFSSEMLQNLQKRIADIETNTGSIEEAGRHIGLVNTCLRLHYYSKGLIHVSIHNDYGAVVTLTMPLNC